MQRAKSPFILQSTIFIWIGFVCAISFMEAWLKFRAPNVTLPIGLGIGKLIFSALNKVEWTLCGILLCALFYQSSKLTKSLFLSIPVLILIVQTLWLLPLLNERADALIQGKSVAPSWIHFYYVASELIKVIFLFILGLKSRHLWRLNSNPTNGVNS